MTLNVHIRAHDQAEERTVIPRDERVVQPYGVLTTMMAAPSIPEQKVVKIGRTPNQESAAAALSVRVNNICTVRALAAPPTVASKPPVNEEEVAKGGRAPKSVNAAA
jgi:hypothetical protein